MDLVLKMQEVAKIAVDSVEMVYWENTKIDALFGKRTAREILADREVFYMKPCFDFALLFCQMINDKGIEAYLVAQKIQEKNALHFGAMAGDKFMHYTGMNLIAIEPARKGIIIPNSSSLQTAYSYLSNRDEMNQAIEEIKRKNNTGLYLKYKELGRRPGVLVRI
jgi:hypothetical protein